MAGVISIADTAVQTDDGMVVVTVETNPNDRPLLEYISGLPAGIYNEAFVRKTIAELVRIVETIHERDVVCGHLLPTKLYHDGMRLRVMAFGLGKYMAIADQKYFIPELECFIAPEVFHDYGAYRPSADLYSIGALMLLLLTGNNADGDDLPTSTASDDARDLMEKLMDPKPFYRPRASEVLQHQWFDDKRAGDPAGGNWVAIQAAIAQRNNQRALYDRVDSVGC